MTMQRPRTARQLISNVGRWPIMAACAMSIITLPSVVWAQGAAPAAEKPRDPMNTSGSKEPGKAKVVVTDQMTVDLHVKDEDLANVLELLSIQTQKNIIASKGVSGKVTATLYKVTFYQALDAILHVNGFGYVEKGNFLYVYTNEELKAIQAQMKKRVSKTIRLNYLNADDAKEFVTPLLSKDGGEIKINTKSKDFSIPDKAPVGKNEYALGDLMVIFDYEENVAAVEELVRQIDTRPQQVLVEATILQTAINEANAFGVDFSVIGDLNFVDFINNGGPLSAANNLIKGGTGSSTSGLSPANDRGNAISSTPGNTGGPGTFKLGVIAGDVSIFLRMLDQVTDTVILSNPKILALNRQPARVLVGKRVGYLNTTQTETSTTQSVEFLDTGTQLYFRPFVSNEGLIRMELKPQVSSAEIRTVTDTGGRAVTIPDEVTQELVTNVNVRDGQTIVLGGLFTENSTFTRRQVPIVGDIPILGAAFRGHEDSTQRGEIIFLITPTIVTDTLVASSAERATSDIERVRAGSRQGLLPWSREKMTDTLNVEAEQLAREGKFDEASYKLQRSLSLNPQQPAAYRLRERITGERENWNDPSMLNSYLDREVMKRSDSIPAGSAGFRKPFGATEIPRVPATKPSSSWQGSAYTPEKFSDSAMNLPGQAGSQQFAGATISTIDNPRSAQLIAENVSQQAQSPEQTPTLPAEPAPVQSEPSSTITQAETEQHSQVLPQDQPVESQSINQPISVQVAQESQFNTANSSPLATSQPAPVSLEVAPSGEWVTGTSFSSASFQQNSTSFEAPASNAVESTAKPAVLASNLSQQEQVDVGTTKTMLASSRNHIQLFSQLMGGELPQLGAEANFGWQPLFDSHLITKVPANSYVGGPNASKVVIGEQPDAKFHTNYGWVYNPKSGQLWAVGFDSNDRPIAKGAQQTASVQLPLSQPNAQESQMTIQPSSEPLQAGVESDQK